MDLMDLRPAEEARPLQLIHPVDGSDLTHEGAPVRVFVEGPDTPRMMAFERAISQRRLNAARRSGRMDLSVEEIEQETLDRIAEAITGWEHIIVDGAPLAWSKAAAKDLCRKLPWFRNQVDAFYRDGGNFIKAASGKTSEPL